MSTATLPPRDVPRHEVLADEVSELVLETDAIPARSVYADNEDTTQPTVTVGSFDARRDASAAMQYLVAELDAPYDACGIVYAGGSTVSDPVTGEEITHPPVWFIRFRV